MAMLRSTWDIKQMIIPAMLLLYLLMAMPKFESFNLFSDNLVQTQVELVDILNDRLAQDKEFDSENYYTKLFIGNLLGVDLGGRRIIKKSYGRIYKDIKLNTPTRPPRI